MMRERRRALIKRGGAIIAMWSGQMRARARAGRIVLLMKRGGGSSARGGAVAIKQVVYIVSRGHLSQKPARGYLIRGLDDPSRCHPRARK